VRARRRSAELWYVGGSRPPRFVRHSWVGVILTLVIIFALSSAIVFSGRQIRVSGAYPHQAGTSRLCQAQVTVRAYINTDGMPGTVSYQWIWPGGIFSPVRGVSFSVGQTTAQVSAPFTFVPSESGTYMTAVLRILWPDPQSARARLFYLCLPSAP
jgi:hypothetical protein